MNAIQYNMLLQVSIEVELISLEARLKEASGYAMNLDMLIECNLLRSQIKALRTKLESLKS